MTCCKKPPIFIAPWSSAMTECRFSLLPLTCICLPCVQHLRRSPNEGMARRIRACQVCCRGRALAKGDKETNRSAAATNTSQWLNHSFGILNTCRKPGEGQWRKHATCRKGKCWWWVLARSVENPQKIQVPKTESSEKNTNKSVSETECALFETKNTLNTS